MSMAGTHIHVRAGRVLCAPGPGRARPPRAGTITAIVRLPALAAAAALAFAVPMATRAAPPPRCKIDRRDTLAFGFYDPFAAAPHDAMSVVGYDCMTTPGPIIMLSAGSSGSFALRTMRFGATTLGYNVFADAARTQILGDGTGGSVTIDATSSRKQTVPLHGRIFAGQLVPAGDYTDTLVVTILF